MEVVGVDTVVVVVDTVAVGVDTVVGVVVTAVEDMAVVMVWKLAMNSSTQVLQQILPMSMPRNCSTVVAEGEEDTEVVVAAVEDMVVGDMVVAVEVDMVVVVADMVVDTRK
jgi:hypothetical protein